MFKAAAATAAVVLLCASLALAAPVAELSLDPVSSLNVTAYKGLWYQMYGDRLTDSTFSRGSYCATAYYGLFPNGSVSVFNSEHYEGYDGPYHNITGYAYYKDASQPGKLSVVLFGGSPFPAPYWVYKLGPIVGGQYDYAVVSDGYKASLFILTRDVTRFQANYQKDVLAWVQANGWDTFINKPDPIPQDQSKCTYSPYPKAVQH